MPPTLLLSPQLKTDAPSAHFIFLLCGRAKSAARPVIHPNLDQEHMTIVLYARHPASVLVSYVGMVLKRALVEPTDRGLMLNEGKTDVLPNEAVGASEGRNTTERKIADPNACQIAARRRCTLGDRRARAGCIASSGAPLAILLFAVFAAGMAAVYHYGLLGYAVKNIVDSLHRIGRAALREMGF